METRGSLFFPPFRLEVSSEQLRREDQPIALRPKTFAVLRYLVEHAGQLVTKDELLDVVWAGTVVSDTVLKSCIRELREALGDDAQAPQYIATVHRRGYRFLPTITSQPVRSSEFGVRSSHSLAPSPQHPAPPLVGRDAELTQLQTWLDKALRGQRQLIFVTGEAGIGKTTLIETFLYGVRSREEFGVTTSPKSKVQSPKLRTPNPELPATPGPWISRGQCIEQYGAGEAYMPILEALGRLCREAGGEQLIALLHQHAPTWLVQMSTLLDAVELEALQRKVQGATRERMLREMGEAVDAITAECLLVLWLEDLHWSDPSTLELLALLARRREPARLLVIGTYRPVDVIVKEHPLKEVKQELQVHGQCAELAVRLLTEEAVGEYLAMRLSDGTIPASPSSPFQELVHAIHERTEGNPLFMVSVVDELLRKAQVDSATVEASTPETIRQMIERQLERLSAEEQHLLEAASVAGMEFSAAAVAAGAEVTVEAVEEQCSVLARRGQFLQAKGTAAWPDGTVATRYGFLHALYQEVLYECAPVGQRVRLHQRIGERSEAAYGERAREIAAELAVHFERGRDYHRGVRYLRQAGDNALRRNAHQEAITLLTKGLELLKALPDAPGRTEQELSLQIALTTPLIATKGYAALEVEQVCDRARELCQQVKETPQLFSVLVRLCAFHMERAELHTAQELAERLLHLATTTQGPFFLLWAQLGMGELSFFLGEFVLARTHLEQSFSFYNPQGHHSYGFVYDPGVYSLSRSALILYLLGYPDHAIRRSQEAFALAQKLSHSYSLTYALGYAADIHRERGELYLGQELEKARVELCTEQGFVLELAYGTIYHGWTLARQGLGAKGIGQIRQGLAAFRATGSKLGSPKILGLLAAACEKAEQTQDGLAALVEALALVHKTGERFYEAELYRLKGELTLQSQTSLGQVKGKSQTRQNKSTVADPRPLAPDPQGEAEGYFLKAIDIAQHQQAKSWELRASTSLARLWQQQGKQKQAHKLLAEIYGWFTEGFDTKDLQEAKRVRDALI